MLIREVSKDKIDKTIIAANHLLNNFTNHDPFAIAKELKIRIVYDFLTDNVPAFITRDKLGVTIYIDSSLDSLSRKMVCFHELGHYFNGDLIAPCLFDKDIDPEKEFLANVFMATLYPQASVRLVADESTDIAEINDYFCSQIRYIAR